MEDDFKEYRKKLREAKRDFLKATTDAKKNLTRRRDRLNADLKKVNNRVTRTEADLKIKIERLANTSRTARAKTAKSLISAIAKSKQSIADAKAEGRKLRAELKIVRRDLADASRHFSHALHIDRAVTTIETKLKIARENLRQRRKARAQKKAA